MANGVNKIFLVGNLGREPTLRHTTTGSPVCELNLAVNESWNDNNGKKQERTEWCTVVVWGKTGEACAKHLVKGQQVYVEGRLQTRSWEDQDGQKRYKTEVVAINVLFLSGGRKRDEFDPAPDPGGEAW